MIVRKQNLRLASELRFMQNASKAAITNNAVTNLVNVFLMKMATTYNKIFTSVMQKITLIQKSSGLLMSLI